MVPAGSLEVDKVALPELRVPVPSEVVELQAVVVQL